MTEAVRWPRIAERGSLLGLRVTIWCYRLFGHRLSLILVHAIVSYFFLTDRRGRAASRAYLRRVHATPDGAAALGCHPGVWASLLHYRAFALSIFDRIVLWFGREGEFEFEVSGREYFDRLLRSDRGAIVVGAHLGSFDALRALAGHDDRVVNVLMFTRHAPRINAIFRQLSPDVEARVIHADAMSVASVLRIRACIERGEIVAMLGDRVEPNDRRRTCRVPLLGDAVELPQAPYLLAGLLGCPLVFVVGLRVTTGRYRVFMEPISERVELARAEREMRVRELAAAYAARLEHYTRAAPYQWFNFFDFWQEGVT